VVSGKELADAVRVPAVDRIAFLNSAGLAATTIAPAFVEASAEVAVPTGAANRRTVARREGDATRAGMTVNVGTLL
jgi:hypothetical protein